MNEVRANLILAEEVAKNLFNEVEQMGLIAPGKTEKQLNDEVVGLAKQAFGITDFWHKKIVRAGANTMQPYGGDPPDVMIQANDLVILDFGPIVNGYEADVARTYQLGNDTQKAKLITGVEKAWQEVNAWYKQQTNVTGAQVYQQVVKVVESYGYTFPGEIAGHVVGPYPHEQLGPGNLGLDIHPDNHQDMFLKDPQGNDRHWILEVHFVDKANNQGAFFEQLIS